MNNQEAIKWLREAEILDLSSGNTKDREAVDLAVEAMKKQIPKKLIADDDGDADGEMVYDSFYCPSCDHHMEDYEVKDYCPNCGQKICWEEER